MNPSSNNEFSLVIDGQTYTVKIEELAGGDLAVELDGTIHKVSLAEAAHQAASQQSARANKPAVQAPVAARQPAAQPAGGGADVLSAPMPGDIVQINIKVGDPVRAGEEVCVLEAMKMKNLLRSSRDGVVKSIEVSIGQSVKYGDVLVRFES